jgi:thymidylate synthase
MATIDKKYHKLLNKIIKKGRPKGDRTGTGTISIGDGKIKYNMKHGFPLLTTKKMFTKGIITELLWFLSGSTDLRELVEQRNNIWVGDSYKRYKKHTEDMAMTEREKGDPKHILSRDEFIERVIKDDEFNKTWGDLGPIYGKQWVKWDNYKHYLHGRIKSPSKPFATDGIGSFRVENKPINQIQNVIDTLRTNPDSRRMIVSAWNVGELDQMILPPCHWAFKFYTEELTYEERCQIQMSRFDIYSSAKEVFEGAMVREVKELTMDDNNIPKRRISLKWHQRSVDTPLGLPFNIASYAFLLEMVAQQVNMIPHQLIGDLSDVHIYNNQMDGVNEQLQNDTNKYKSPKLKLNKAKDIFSYKLEDFEITDYESYPTIKFPLSN